MSRSNTKIDYIELEDNGELAVHTTDNMAELLEKTAPFISKLYNIVKDDPLICAIDIPKCHLYEKLTTICNLPVYQEQEIIKGSFIITKQGAEINSYVSLNDREKDLLLRSFTKTKLMNGKVVCTLDTTLAF